MGQTRVKDDNTNYVINSKNKFYANELRKAAQSRDFNKVVVLDSKKTCITTVKSNLPDLRNFAKQFRSTCKTFKFQIPDTYISHCNQIMSIDYRYVHENSCERCIENKTAGEVKRKAVVKINQEAHDINERNRLSEVTTTEVVDYRLNKSGTHNYRYSKDEKKLVERLLHENKGNVTETCAMTLVDDNTIKRWLRRGDIKPYEGEDAYVKSNRGNEYSKEEKQQAIDLFHELGSIHEVMKSTGIPDATLHGWIRPEVKYERLSIKELNEKYEYHMAQADMIDKIKTEKESKRSENLEKISELEDFLKTGMKQLEQLKQEIE
jgi:transposase-like protein